MPIAKTSSKEGIVVSALRARSGFGKLLNRVDKESRSLVIQKRGTPRAILLSIRDYVALSVKNPRAKARRPFLRARLTASSGRRARKKRLPEKAALKSKTLPDMLQ